MPDGDRVHPGLTRPYQKVYKQLCEGQFNEESLATGVVETVKRQLQQGGDAPAHLIAQIAAQLNAISKEPLLTNWQGASRDIEQLAAQAGVPKRIGQHIVEASKGLLYDIRTGGAVPNLDTQLMERSLNRMYTAEFEQRVPMAQHYSGASQEFVDGRLDAMRPLVQKKLAHIARQAAKRVSFQRLRRPPTVKAKVDLGTDIASLN